MSIDDDSVIRDESGDHRYFTVIPNMVWEDQRLSVDAKCLYGYYKRVAGEHGECFQTSTMICDRLGLTRSAFFRARKGLIDAGYISAQEDVGRASIVTIVDVWPDNMAWAAGIANPSQYGTGLPLETVNPSHIGTPPVPIWDALQIKKIPLRRSQKKSARSRAKWAGKKIRSRHRVTTRPGLWTSSTLPGARGVANG